LDVTASIEEGKDQNEICELFFTYFERLKHVLFDEYPIVKSLTIKDKEGIFRQIYDYSMIKLYHRIFPKEASLADKQFLLQIESLSKLAPEQLNIKYYNYHPELINLFIKSNSQPVIIDLKRIDKFLTPKSKLKAHATMHKQIVDSLGLLAKNEDNIGAEDPIPLLVYLYSQNQPSHVISTIK